MGAWCDSCVMMTCFERDIPSLNYDLIIHMYIIGSGPDPPLACVHVYPDRTKRCGVRARVCMAHETSNVVCQRSWSQFLIRVHLPN